MPRTGKKKAIGSLWVLLGVCAALAGCTTGRELVPSDGNTAPGQSTPLVGATGLTRLGDGKAALAEHDTGGPPPWTQGIVARPAGLTLPHESEKVAHPTYVIEPPDTLFIDAVRLIPRPPYRVEPLDALRIDVDNALPNAPIGGIYVVEPSGTVDLGFTYGSVAVHGKTLDEVKASIRKHLTAPKKAPEKVPEKAPDKAPDKAPEGEPTTGKLLPPFEVYVSLAQSRVMQQVRGEHLVRQDGTVGLGTYGSVYVTGMTIAQAKAAIETHLSQFLFEPKVSIDVSGFNSHVYFVIFDFPGTGQQIQRLPITGNETVLDALGGFTVKGLPAGVSKRRIWVARPGPANSGHDQILPVDWAAITRNGSTATNYQLLPGDRIYVAQDPLATVDVTLSRVFAPIERVFGITLFGNSVINNLKNPNGSGNGGTGGGVR